MLNIGNQVSYIREMSINKENKDAPKTKEGGGKVKAIFADPANRVMVRIVDNEPDDKGGLVQFDVPLMAVNPSEEFKKDFIQLVEDIDKMATEANKQQQAMVDRVNAELEKMKNKLLGEPIEF